MGGGLADGELVGLLVGLLDGLRVGELDGDIDTLGKLVGIALIEGITDTLGIDEGVVRHKYGKDLNYCTYCYGTSLPVLYMH